MQKINKYIDDTNVSLKADIVNKALTGAPDTEVSGIRLAVLQNSSAMEVFNTMVLGGDQTEQPFLNLPASTDSDFVVDGITITRTNVSTTSVITDETMEDSVPDLRAALDIIVASQTILKLEGAISTALQTVPTVTGSRPKTFQGILNIIKEFPEQTKRIVGRWYAFVSVDTHFDIFAELTTVQLALMDRAGISLVPVYGLPDNQLIVAHSHGLAGGLVVRSIEDDREGISQEVTLLSSASVGVGIDNNYAKRATLT